MGIYFSNYFLLLSCAAVIFAAFYLFFKRDEKALFYSLVIILCSPLQVYISPPGFALITIPRVIIPVIIIVYLMAWRVPTPLPVGIWKYLLLVIIIYVISCLFSGNQTKSFKYLLSFLITNVAFFFVMVKVASIERFQRSIIKAIVVSTCLVTLFGLIEVYTFWNPINYLPDLGGSGKFYQAAYTLGRGFRPISLMAHPILLGVFLGMGFPFLLLEFSYTNKRFKKTMILLVSIGCLICIYKTQSRGPWFGVVLTSILIYKLSKNKLRKILLALAIMGVLGMVVRPGVFDVLENRIRMTFLQENVEENPMGKSYAYRGKLIQLGVDAIKKDPIKLLFGYGLRTFPDVGLIGEISGQEEYFDSSDVGYIRILVEAGTIGLLAYITFFIHILIRIYNSIRVSSSYMNDLAVTCFCAIVMFLFSMLSVNSMGWKVDIFLFMIVSIGLGTFKSETILILNEVNSDNFSRNDIKRLA